MAVPFEDFGIALTKHLCDEMIGNPAGAEPRSESVPKVIRRKVRDAGLSQRIRPNFPELGDVGPLGSRAG